MTAYSNETAVQTVIEMIERNFGEKYCDWFLLSISENDEKSDFFKISTKNDKVSIIASNGVCLARGVYYYLKHFCHVHISQAGENKAMPLSIILPQKEIYRATNQKIRYAYNYCTHSYTMAFWGEKEWQKELDFLAFQGVNLVLDITGEEKVWFLFFKRIGYSDDEARKLLVGPAYWAWFCMANMYSYGGILPDEYLDRRVALANKNHEFMAKLGMKPCLMGYCGMVPDNIKEINSSAQIIHQGDWNKFLRPAMLRTNKKTYAEYAEIFYEVQREVLGDITNYFSTDPFHEGGIKGTISDKTVAKHILGAMKKENENSVWVVQSWGSNPAKGLLKAVKSSKENVLILDLYAEKEPRFKNFRGNEFYDTPWIYCMLDNFGGKNGIHGHLENLHKDIPYAINNSKCMKGIGITPEGSNTNPFFTEFVFDSIWNENPECVKPVNMKDWTSDYLYARYGKNSENANKCFSILCDTAFSSKDNGEGPEESIINARPALKINSVSAWGHSKIEYDKNELVKAYELLIIDYDKLKSSDAYIYDVTDIKRQILSNKAQDIHEEMAKAFKNKDLNLFKSLSNDFLDVVLEVDSILNGRNEFSLDYWLNLAKKASEGLYEDTQKMFVQNAKRLITSWGDREHSEDGRLYDYSNRQWNGLTKQVYYKRWKLWIDNRIKELEGQKPKPEDFFEMQNDWILKD